MDSFYKFASESPWLTFFIALLVGQVIIRVFRAIFGRKDTDN
jgi:hypothetical protein